MAQHHDRTETRWQSPPFRSHGAGDELRLPGRYSYSRIAQAGSRASASPTGTLVPDMESRLSSRGWGFLAFWRSVCRGVWGSAGWVAVRAAVRDAGQPD